jgi:hypothetical protein
MFPLLDLYWVDYITDISSAKLEAAMLVWKANARCCCLDLVESGNVDRLHKVFERFDFFLELID